MSCFSELLEKANKDSKKKPSAEEKKMYCSDLLKLFKENGVTDESVFYLASGIKFSAIQVFIDWNKDFDQEKRVENIISMLSTNKIVGMDNQNKLRLYLHLLIAELNENEVNQIILGELLHSIVDFSYKKDQTRLSDFGKIFKAVFVSRMKTGTKLPVLTAYNFQKEYVGELIFFFSDAISSMEPKGEEEIDKRDILRNWLNRQMAKAASENKEEMQADDKKEAALSKQSAENEVQIPLSTQDKKAEPSSVKPQIEKSDKITSFLGKRLMDLAKTADDVDRELQSTQEKLKSAKHELTRIKIAYDELQTSYKDSTDKNEHLQRELSVTKQQLEGVLIERQELADRVSRQVSVIDVFDQDKANTKTEILNQIATALKKIYVDFKVAESMEMTIDLGENMRDSLDDVFRKLKKCGIDIEGR